MLATVAAVATGAACGATAPAAPAGHLSAAQHDRAGRLHDRAAAVHASATAMVEQRRCPGLGGRAPADDDVNLCWTTPATPTSSQRDVAEHRRRAASHRAASLALRNAEATACVGLSEDDRDVSPFVHVDDITDVELFREYGGTDGEPTERVAGAVVTFRGLPGATVAGMQRVMDCHLARNASLGHPSGETPDCPLALSRTEARVSSSAAGFTVVVRSDDGATAREILARAERLRRAAATRTSGASP